MKNRFFESTWAFRALIIVIAGFGLACGNLDMPNVGISTPTGENDGCHYGADGGIYAGDTPCASGVCTPRGGCEAAPSGSKFGHAAGALEISDSLKKLKCSGTCLPRGLRWCGNGSLNGAPYDGMWDCVGMDNGDGTCTTEAQAIDCPAGMSCELTGSYPSYGQCIEPVECVDDADCLDTDQCTTDQCTDSKCVHTMPEGLACDDGMACTEDDMCTDGTCAGATKACNDMNACTTDSCNADTGTCEFWPIADGTACDDGMACTTGDMCMGGLCSATLTECDDDSTCTTDSCNADTGNCQYIPVPDSTMCDDGDLCTSGQDWCEAGACVGTPADCDDGNLCTSDACDPATGNCTSMPMPDNAVCGADMVCVAMDCVSIQETCTVDGAKLCRTDGAGNEGYYECDVAEGADMGVWMLIEQCTIACTNTGCLNP